MFLTTGSVAGAQLVITDRVGGVSRGRYDSLNLGDHVGDDHDAVGQNRHRVAAALDPSAGP
ncbi:MAG: Multi-copper polyphenol oxidoreductase laccase, partial [Actinomycetota bacterium]|nr:Multi-copper polyphenol oxidoreductase laccase [Actinomycetota bacterium]